MTVKSGDGRIITFYSYKGGTGRSMALANVAWILASHGLRVLAIDWDLEAPGLHRYFHPFLEDKELEKSPGLIDYVVDFTEAARHAERDKSTPSSADKWYDRYTSLLRYTYSLNWDFGEGTLDFVPAGQQGLSYSTRVNGFDWQEFYDKLGGGILLEALKKRLREDYDYVLIDSRTGISDTSGICTVQMPDDLVVCFTLNQQSIKGAAAVAASSEMQRLLATGEPSLRIWPVPTRVESAEKERLEIAYATVRSTFQRYLGRLRRDERESYWGEIGIPYQPYFAYEEVLAVFTDRYSSRISMLPSYESLANRLTNGAIRKLAEMNERDRAKGLSLFQREPGLATGTVFISYPYDELEKIEPIVSQLRERFGDAVWWEQAEIFPGDDWAKAIRAALQRAKIVLAFFGPKWAKRNEPRNFELQIGSLLKKRSTFVIPLLVGGLKFFEWAEAAKRLNIEEIANLQAINLADDAERGDEHLSDVVRRTLSRFRDERKVAEDPDDPQKGKWGGRSTVDERTLSAKIDSISDDWYGVTLIVTGTKDRPLEGSVDFHLHPTFPNSVVTVDAINGQAKLDISSWGAFTVGATADDGETMLELDLSKIKSFPENFRKR